MLRLIAGVIDSGANVGHSAAYFLSRSPGAFVVAVEPDAGDFAALEENLIPYRDWVHAIKAGVWSQTADFVLDESSIEPGNKWGRTVWVAKPGEAASIPAADIGSILAVSGFAHFDTEDRY